METTTFRILVVDDNQDGARSLAAVLTAKGHRTQVAFNGAVAVRVAGSFKPELILLDIGMAGLDGLETCRAIRRGAPLHTRIVAITGRDSMEDRQRSREAGFDEHWVKPVEMAVLEELLASL